MSVGWLLISLQAHIGTVQGSSSPQAETIMDGHTRRGPICSSSWCQVRSRTFLWSVVSCGVVIWIFWCKFASLVAQLLRSWQVQNHFDTCLSIQMNGGTVMATIFDLCRIIQMLTSWWKNCVFTRWSSCNSQWHCASGDYDVDDPPYMVCGVRGKHVSHWY